MGDFDLDTAVTGGDGRYTASLSPDWEIWGPNGGYVAAVGLRAAAAEAPGFRPASYTCHFLAVGAFAPVVVEVGVARAAKRAVALHLTMRQDDLVLIQGLAWFVRDVAGLEHDHSPPLDFPGPDELRSAEEWMPPDTPPRFPFWANI